MSRRQEGIAMELLIQQGLVGLESGEYTSVYSGAKSLGISEAILRRRRRKEITTRSTHKRSKSVRFRRKYSLEMDFNIINDQIIPFVRDNQDNDRSN